MMDKNQVYNDELEQMRQDMSELRSLLSEQKIVNERLMRRAMKSELDKERRVTLQTLLPLCSPCRFSTSCNRCGDCPCGSCG